MATWEPRVPQQGAPFPRRLGRQKAGRPTRLSPCKPATMARWTCTPRASVHTSSISPHREPIVCSQAQSERAQPAWLESTTPGGYESKGWRLWRQSKRCTLWLWRQSKRCTLAPLAPEQTLHIHPSSSSSSCTCTHLLQHSGPLVSFLVEELLKNGVPRLGLQELYRRPLLQQRLPPARVRQFRVSVRCRAVRVQGGGRAGRKSERVLRSCGS